MNHRTAATSLLITIAISMGACGPAPIEMEPVATPDPLAPFISATCAQFTEALIENAIIAPEQLANQRANCVQGINQSVDYFGGLPQNKSDANGNQLTLTFQRVAHEMNEGETIRPVWASEQELFLATWKTNAPVDYTVVK